MAKEPENKSSEQPTIPLEDVKKLIDEAVAEALKNAEEEKIENVSRNRSLTPRKRRDADELVTIMIPLTHEHSDDVVLSINDETCIVKRGKRVKVKKKFARMYENSRLQQAAALEYMEKTQAESRARFEKM